MNKSEEAMAAVIDMLLAAGFVPDGETRVVHVRIPTANSPVFGRSGGEMAKLGGRQRFVKQGTTIKATIGLRTTALYRSEGNGLNGVRGIATHDTKDLSAICAVVETL
jgi:hypothetical protein